MELPDKAFLLRIKKRNVYLDKKSIEASTGRLRKKYKLAGNELLSHYFFNILTSHPDTCKLICTLKIEQKDWEEKIEGPYLLGDASYCDVTKFEMMEISELVRKIKDKNNTFRYIAKLRPDRFRELQRLQIKACNLSYVPDVTKNIISEGLTDIVSDLARKLGLN
jgi:hypothetical protein